MIFGVCSVACLLAGVVLLLRRGMSARSGTEAAA
jgi:hypothetical protein